MTLLLGQKAPEFDAQTTKGHIAFHDWAGSNWTLLLSFPKVFTPICTGELATLARKQAAFEERGVKLLGVGTDCVSQQEEWIEQVKRATGFHIEFPLIEDANSEIAELYGMVQAGSQAGPLTPDNPRRVVIRSAILIGPAKNVRLILAYPDETRRNFEEILRVIDSIRLTEDYKNRDVASIQPLKASRKGNS